ncbi:MAG TPA: hypothetical protein VJU77_10910 [Chthoniobacterales bacterium]|nr:hypothetical protein [Chthoniobacterales bacterium]
MRHCRNLLTAVILGAWLVCAASASGASLRYDGIYRRKGDAGEYTLYLRFYSDGTALSVAASETPEQVVQWFHRGPGAPSGGHFTAKGASIRFTIIGFESREDCAGTIKEDSLMLKCQGGRRALRFDFVPLHLTK